MPHKVATFYQFLPVPEPSQLRDALETQCHTLGLFGTVIIAQEGINGTLAGPPNAITTITNALQSGALANPAFTTLNLKFSHAENAHFDRLKIRIKPEIVTLRRPEANPTTHTGTHIPPHQWNLILNDPTITLIDTRKTFEIEIGTFPGAINPGLTSFRQFPDFAASQLNPESHKRLAMFCTGGIRCEKASAYLLAAGFPEVLQLQGGILRYLEEVPEHESRWVGHCFVFDQRIALGHGLALAAPAPTSNLHPNLLDSARGSIAQ